MSWALGSGTAVGLLGEGALTVGFTPGLLGELFRLSGLDLGQSGVVLRVLTLVTNLGLSHGTHHGRERNAHAHAGTDSADESDLFLLIHGLREVMGTN